MPANQDYPRMMFHRSKPPVTIHSREEENELGAEWRRTVWPQGGDYPAAIPAPELSTVSAVPETDAAPGDGDPPGAPHQPDRPQLTYNKPPEPVAKMLAEIKAEPEPPPKRQRAPTVKPTGKAKRKYGRD